MMVTYPPQVRSQKNAGKHAESSRQGRSSRAGGSQRRPRPQSTKSQNDRGASIPTREMKQQMHLLKAWLRMPIGALGAQDTAQMREDMKARLEFYRDLLAARDDCAAGTIDGTELARRTDELVGKHYAA